LHERMPVSDPQSLLAEAGNGTYRANFRRSTV
jgi:hypothetical protein